MRTNLFSRIVWIGAALAALIFVWWLLILFSPHGATGSSVGFVVQEGESVFDISNRLADEGVTQSRFVFWSYSALSGKARFLKAGEYEFSFPVSLRRVAIVLSGGNSAIDEVSVLIPEGFTLVQIKNRLKEAELAGADRFLALATIRNWQDSFSFLSSAPEGRESLEGFLFPDTYRFNLNMSNEAVITKFLRTFENKTSELRQDAQNRGRNFYNIVILASILEKEVPLEDMPLAAGVLLKRLQAGVPLQVDATLVYVLGRPIKREDTTSLDSLYNTYRYLGFPPTPIANPGFAALSAALNPQTSDYWYYLSRRSDGATIFSRTLEEHNVARAKYLR